MLPQPAEKDFFFSLSSFPNTPGLQQAAWFDQREVVSV
jgi:hypothetical protein